MYQITINGKSVEYGSKLAAEKQITEDGYNFQYSDNGGTRSHFHHPSTGDMAVVEPAERKADVKSRYSKKTPESE